MPGFDGTGPLGKGPGTGRRQGKCKDSDIYPKKKNNSTDDNSRLLNFFRKINQYIHR